MGWFSKRKSDSEEREESMKEFFDRMRSTPGYDTQSLEDFSRTLSYDDYRRLYRTLGCKTGDPRDDDPNWV